MRGAVFRLRGAGCGMLEINTDRLILSVPERADFAAVMRLWNLPEVYRFIGGAPRPEAQLWAAFLSNIGAWNALGAGMWQVVRRDTGALIGQVGFPCAMRGHGAGFDEYIESGWLFEAAAQGQGFGREAMIAALEWFDAADLADRCVCMIDPANVASMRLADKLGFVKTRLSIFEGDELQLFERRVQPLL